MIRRTFVALAFGLALFGAAGCASSGVQQIGAVTVPLNADKTRTDVAAKVGYLITLELPPVELAGFGWQVFMHDARFLTQKSEITPAKAPGGRATLSFLAIRSTERVGTGKTTIRFLLTKQDGAKEAQPVDGHDVVFSIE
jgi:hypothetical protein